jgi:DNA-binding NarL/FixJ family response regulator
MRPSTADSQRRVLIVEDNVLIAMEMEYIVGDCGCAVVGPVSNVASGLEAVRQTEIDGAVLDVNLGDERVWPIAEVLDERGIPSC